MRSWVVGRLKRISSSTAPRPMASWVPMQMGTTRDFPSKAWLSKGSSTRNDGLPGFITISVSTFNSTIGPL